MARAAGAFIVVLIIVVGALVLLGRHGSEGYPPWLAHLLDEAEDAADGTADVAVTTPGPVAPADKGPTAPPADTAAAPPATTAPSAETAPAPSPSTSAAAVAPTTPEPAPAASAPAPTGGPETPAAAPSPTGAPNPATFDIARVEPSGDAVLAGRADPKSIVALYANGREVARTQANDAGEWVVTLDKPLAPGEYELMIVTATPDGAHQVESRERLAVSVPSAAGEPPMVALVAPDSPTKVLQQPDAAPDAVAAAPMGTPAAEVGAAGGVAVSTVAKNQDRITVTGKAAPDATVRLYFDDKPIGETRAGPDGAWTLSVEHPAGPGKHAVRVDQVSPADGSVVARSEVPFEVLGEADIAAAEASPTPAGADDATVADGAVAPPPQAADPTPPAEPSAVADAAAPAEAKRTAVRIRRGDDLWSIAERLYGSGERYTAIYRANRRQIRDPDLIYPGQLFTLPN